MTDGLHNTTPLGGAQNETRPLAGPQAQAQGSAVHFQALLDQLGQRADSLKARSLELDANTLLGATLEARESMQDALALGQDLLEAYRQQHLQQGE